MMTTYTTHPRYITSNTRYSGAALNKAPPNLRWKKIQPYGWSIKSVLIEWGSRDVELSSYEKTIMDNVVVTEQTNCKALFCVSSVSPWLVNYLHLPSATLVSLVSHVVHLFPSPLYIMPVFPLSLAWLLCFVRSPAVRVASVYSWPACLPWPQIICLPLFVLCYFLETFFLKERFLLSTPSPVHSSAHEFLPLASRGASRDENTNLSDHSFENYIHRLNC